MAVPGTPRLCVRWMGSAGEVSFKFAQRGGITKRGSGDWRHDGRINACLTFHLGSRVSERTRSTLRMRERVFNSARLCMVRLRNWARRLLLGGERCMMREEYLTCRAF